jgi:hypothetical protein
MALLAPVTRKLALAQAASSPRRVILIFSPNGPMSAAGPASGTETNFTLHDWWKPLERHKADGLFMSHMAATGSGTVQGDGHGLGGQVFGGFGSGSGDAAYQPLGETIDQVIGKRLEAEGRGGVVRSVVWGNTGLSRSGGTAEAFSAGESRSIVPETDPSVAWSQLFAGFVDPGPNPDEARAAALLARNQSVLDFVVQDCKALQNELGAEGMALLEDHCTTVRSIEKNLVNGGALGRCVAPADPGELDWSDPENVDAQSDAFGNLITSTLACELTSVVAYQFGGQAARNRLAEKYGIPTSPVADSGDSGPAHHPWTHQPDGEAKVEALRIFTSFYAEQVANLLDKLKTTNDLSGNPLMDSTVVLWLSELGGNETNLDNHQTGSMPAMLFGKGQGTFKTGRYYRGKSPDGLFSPSADDARPAGAELAQVLVAIQHYMGLTDLSTVGATGVNGPFDWLYG